MLSAETVIMIDTSTVFVYIVLRSVKSLSLENSICICNQIYQFPLISDLKTIGNKSKKLTQDKCDDRRKRIVKLKPMTGYSNNNNKNNKNSKRENVTEE